LNDPKYDRFRRLERPRPLGPEEAPARSGTGTRIEAVEGPQPTGATERPAEASDGGAPGHLDRFRPEPEPGLELDLSDHDSQPFIRCAACETDSFRTATRCSTCGAGLDTEAQRDFNRRFWDARRAEAAVEAEASAARRVVIEEDQARNTVMARQAAESLARQVGDAERRRLERDGFLPGWGAVGPPVDWSTDGMSQETTPAGVRLLRRLPDGWRVPAGVALVLLPVLLALVFMPAGLLVGAVVLALFSPPRWHTRFGSRFDP
jgi:hypothetical protein